MVGHELSNVGKPLNFVARGERLIENYLREIQLILLAFHRYFGGGLAGWHSRVAYSR